MLVKSLNSIAFQKRLVAKAHVGSVDNSIPVKIYHLDKRDDVQILNRACLDKNWYDNHYLQDVIEEYPECYQTDYHFAMMDKNDKLLAYSVVRDPKFSINDENDIMLYYIETAPRFTSKNPDRKIGRIGETMMAFLAKFAKKKDKDICACAVAKSDEAQCFYRKTCNFEMLDGRRAILHKEDFKDLIKKNKTNTGAKIKILDLDA